MGLIDSIKEKFGIGGSGGSDPDMSIANEYREIQPSEIKSEPKEVEDTIEDVRAETGSYKTHIRKKIKGGFSGIGKSITGAGYRLVETQEEKDFRIKDEERRKLEKATIGMNKQEKAAYEEAHLTQKRTKASEKAKRDVPIGETAEEKQKRLQKKRERKEEVAHAYQKSRASAAGAEAGKSAPPSIFGMTRPENREIKSPTASGLVPHGFMPNVGMGAPGFEGVRNIRPIGFEGQSNVPISQSGELYNPTFSPQPQPQPVPQPERRISRHEQHRQQVQTETERWKREQQQQYFQQNVYNPQPMPMPSHNGTRNQSRYVNLFERQDIPKPVNGKEKMPRLYNPFESHQMTYHNPQEALLENAPHVDLDAIRSAEDLGMIPMGNGKVKGNSKKSKRSNIAPWEL